jgi:hypothetical protein
MSQTASAATATHKLWVAAAVAVCAALALAAGLLLIPAARVPRTSAMPSTNAGLPSPAAPETLTARLPQFADFGAALPPPDTRLLANWVADTRDNANAPFFILDKKAAALYAFDAGAHLLATSPVLLGASAGDESAPGIGNKPLNQVLQAEKTTPAGRFVAERGHNANGEDVIWVDYDAAVSMHRVRATNPAERRLQRLATPTPDDNRISFGCINVPAAFYEAMIRPVFAAQRAIVYVLPEVKTVQQVFGAYDVVQRSALGAQAPTAMVSDVIPKAH